MVYLSPSKFASLVGPCLEAWGAGLQARWLLSLFLRERALLAFDDGLPFFLGGERGLGNVEKDSSSAPAMVSVAW